MATTRIIPMHKNKGKTVAKCLKERTDYAKNPDKTSGGELVSSFMCNPDFADEQFLLSKKIYLEQTGRTQKNDVIAYQVRQSFKPGEITPELANELGYALAEKITKGNHAFIVATHIDKAHIHNHIIWNSTHLNCKKKFRNFWNSTKAIAKINDLLCLSNGLSIVENKANKSAHYGKWLGEDKPLTLSDMLKQTIDAVLLEKPASFEGFLQKMKQQGYEVKTGKHLAFKGKQQKKFIRLRSLGKGYSEEELRGVIGGKVTHVPQKKKAPRVEQKVSLVIDLQSALVAKKGGGYERWAKNFNIKQLAKTMNYLTENNLLSYTDLKAKADGVTGAFSSSSTRIKDAEKRMAEIALLQKYITQFAKTKATYDRYKQSGYSPKFKEDNITEILLHQAAKNHFKSLSLTKLPKMADLKSEYAALLSQKKKAYKECSDLKQEMQEVLNAKRNVEVLLDMDNLAPETEKKKDQQSL
ncbi:relaxase/mobilization nuclease domain-containing protein [Bengtsoniella intestinalis]|uniref:relaxase/mobilization nuclease domain-containing protein n=1 Tax=Bengtsoniella intestinalis TaxID=3073143 RepID=UPI00391F69BB